VYAVYRVALLFEEYAPRPFVNHLLPHNVRFRFDSALTERVRVRCCRPFTAYIYAQREQKRKSGKAAAAPKAQKAKPKNKSKKN
jgi:hypothetical protein